MEARPVNSQFFPLHQPYNYIKYHDQTWFLMPINSSFTTYLRQLHMIINIQQSDCFVVACIIKQKERSRRMLPSFSKYISNDKYCTVTLNNQLVLISIVVVHEQSDVILCCNLKKQDFPSTLLQMFSSKIDLLYSYLSRDDSEITIAQDGEVISLRYSLTFLKKVVPQQVKLPTRKYLPAQDSDFPPTKSQSDEKSNNSYIDNKAESINDIFYAQKNQFSRYNDDKAMEKIHSLTHPYWYSNSCSNLFLRISDKLYPFPNKQGRISYKASIYLKEYHDDHPPPRYDLTIGLVHPLKFEQFRCAYHQSHSEKISLSVIGRKLSSQCFDLLEKKTEKKIVQARSLSIEMITGEKQGQTWLDSIKFIMNEQTLINVFNRQALAAMDERLQQFQEFVPFVYFHRSFLHFSVHEFI